MKYHRHVLVYCVIALFQITSSAQNLAPNPNFANHIICPGNGQLFEVEDWYNISSPDYFHACSATPVMSVPTNFPGHQPSVSDAYIGMKSGEPLGSAFLHREYAQAQLTQPLIAGCYELSITYSNSDYSGFCNGLGMYLSNGIPGPPFTPTYLGLPAQLEVVNIIPDSINWHTISGIYNAVGGETHITLGTFRANIDLTFIPTSGALGTTLAYSLIDSVSVVYIGTGCIPPPCLADAGIISIGNNPSCPSDIISFNVNSYNATPTYDQYILITDTNGIILDMTQGDSFSFSHDHCAEFTVHSYNIEISGTAYIPNIGDHISLIDCSISCCDLISEPFSFEDNIAPNFTFIQVHPNSPSAGTFIDIYCVDDIPAIQPAQYEDNCIGVGSVNGTINDLSNPCLGGTYIRTWEISDSCHTTIEEQTIIIEPSPIPVAINPPADLTVDCDNIPTTNVSLIFSNGLSNSCALNTTVQPIRHDNFDACGGTAQFVWEDTDPCGRPISYTQNLIVTPAPAATYLNTISELTVSCQNIDTISTLLHYSNGSNGICQISGTSNATITGYYDGCGGQLVYDWAFLDQCGRTIAHTLQVSVEASNPPVLDSIPADITLDCGVLNYVPPVLNYTNSASGLCLISGSISPTTIIDSSQIIVTWEEQVPCLGLVTEIQTVTLQPGPDISLDQYTASICEGSYFDLSSLVVTDANNTASTISYHNAAPPNPSNELTSTIVNPNVTTEYFVAASLNGSCMHFVSFSLIVNPSIDLVDSGTGQVCRDTNFYDLFDFLAFANDSSGIWMDLNGAGINLSNPQNVQFINVPEGTYDFSYLIPSSGTCPSDSAIATINVAPLPEIFINSIECSMDLNFYKITFTTHANASVTISSGMLNSPDPNIFEVANISITDTLHIIIQDPQSLCLKEISIVPPDCNCSLVAPPINEGDVVSCVEDLPAILTVMVDAGQDASWYTDGIGGTLLSANSTSYQPTDITPGFYTYYVETFDLLNPDCKSTTRTPVSLTILTPPMVSDIQLSSCQNLDGASTTYFLHNNNEHISANPSYSFSYHLTYDQAVNNSDVIADPYTITGLMNRIIYARVVDDNGCFSIAEITLSIHAQPAVSLNISDLSCPGDSDGSVEITPLFSQGGIMTSLNATSFTSDLFYDNLDTGTYTLSIQDSFLCFNEYTFEILSNYEIYIDLYNLDCDNNGTINDPSDDFYYVRFNLMTDGAGVSYNVFVDMVDIGLFNYGVTETIILPADSNFRTLRFYDPSTGCEKMITTPELFPCSDPCIDYPDATILVDPSNILDCSISSINLSSMNETEVSYQWTFNNNPISNLIIEQEGQVVLIATNMITGCQSSDTLNIINLEAYPLIVLELNDTIACENTSVLIDASLSQSGGQFLYNWYYKGLLIDEFVNQKLISVEAGGWYVLEIIDTDINCINRDSVFVTELTMDWDIALAPELTFNQEDNLLNAYTTLSDEHISSISWSPSEHLSCSDCLNPLILESGVTQYTLVITDIYGCSDSSLIYIKYVEKEIFVPNSFSPNGDGINDYFNLGIPTDLELSQLKLWIYDRWGELIYYKDNLHKAPSTSFWDGSYKNNPLNPGVYVYYFEATTIDNKQRHHYGDLTLIR